MAVAERVRLWLERANLAPNGAGFWLRDAATGEAVSFRDPRIRVVPVAGVSYRGRALQDEAFAPGRPLSLVAEPHNPHDPNAVGVWDADRRIQLGYVPGSVAPEVPPDAQAVSLVEFLRHGERVGLRILIAPADAWIGRPR
jgi:hypothetical protein